MIGGKTIAGVHLMQAILKRLTLCLAVVGGLASLSVFNLSGNMVRAQDLSALARVVPDQSRLVDQDDRIAMSLELTSAVPYRLFTLDQPRRLVLDFNEVDWTGLDTAAFDQSDLVSGLRTGLFKQGWSRMVVDLTVPLAVRTAELRTRGDGSATVALILGPTDAAAFTDNAGAPDAALFDPGSDGKPLTPPRRRQTGDRPLVVVLDPGHGGIDPGAQYEGIVEADLMLIFARELQETLLRTGKFEVVLTREDNSFVPLESRVSVARQAGADAFLSLHADAVTEGRASGATIYTLSESASDIASQRLAERHDRADLLAGVDLGKTDDVIANVLMDMVRRETKPRADNLADALVVGLTNTVGTHKRPRLEAGFSVLKAPDIPSVLLELGFLSSSKDRNRLDNPEWRQRAATGIRDALLVWAVEDAAVGQLLRQ